MVKKVLSAVALLGVLQAACHASFQFSLTPVSQVGQTASMKVSVLPTGEPAGNLTQIFGFSSPISFSSPGVTINSVSQLGPITTVATVPSVLPYSTTSANETMDFTGSVNNPGATLVNGVSTDLYLISITAPVDGVTASLTQVGRLNPDNNLAVLGNTFEPIANAVFSISPSAGSVSIAAVPEPSSFLFMGLVGVCVGGLRWYKKRNAA